MPVPNRSWNRRARNGLSGALMLRTQRSGSSVVMAGSSASIAIAAGGSTTDVTWCSVTRRANSPGSNRSMSTTGAPTRNAKHTL